MTKETQNQAILRHLEEGHGITPLDALDLCGCFRLSARIHDLRERGYNIGRELVEVNGKRVAKYHLITEL